MKRILSATLVIFFIFLCSCAIKTPESTSDNSEKTIAQVQDTVYTLVFHTGTDEFFNSIESTKQGFATITLPTPVKAGYTFDGWYTDTALTNKFDSSAAPTATVIELYARFTEVLYGYTVTVKPNTQNSIILSGGGATQVINNENPEYEKVDIEAAIDYTYLYYEIKGEKYTSSSIVLDGVTENVEITVYTEYATDELPIININTEGAAITSKEDYVNMTFSIENCEEDEYNYSEKTGGIRLRGNSTMGYPKKPYRLKFDKKLSLFGLDASKSWVLLADYRDASGLNNYTAFSLAHLAKSNGADDGLQFTPSPYKVNVYLNGEFVGLYTLCEQVQENSGRINIELDEITEDMTAAYDPETGTFTCDFNFFVCLDYSCASDVGAAEDETYIKIAKVAEPQNPQDYHYFEMKYPEKGGFANEAQFVSYREALRAYLTDMIGRFTATDIDVTALSDKVNMNSLYDYMAIDQIMGERDHVWKSFNMYYVSTSSPEGIGNEYERGKLSFGPIWDYDWSLYTEWAGDFNEDYNLDNALIEEYSNIFFNGVKNDPELFNSFKIRFNERFVPALDTYIDSLADVEYGISESLRLNSQKWYADKPDLTENNIAYLNGYLIARRDCLKERFYIA